MLLNYYLIGSTTVQSKLDFMTTDCREKNERKKHFETFLYNSKYHNIHFRYNKTRRHQIQACYKICCFFSK